MIPLLWRYLLRHYLQVFFLSVFTFIAVLLITRMHDIFSFAALGAPLYMVLLFTLYQIPYILPYAIAISSLLAAMLLSSRLSSSHELTAMRTSGISLREITAPTLIVATFFALLNFLIVSELTPQTRYLSKELLHEATTVNPLFLMKKSKLLNIDDSYVDMDMVKMGKEARNVLFIVKTDGNDRLDLFMADKLAVTDDILKGKRVSIVSSLGSKDETHFDNLLIENQESMETDASNLTKLLQRSSLGATVEHVPTKRLFTDLKYKQKVRPKDIKRVEFEMARRLFFPVTTFAFTFLGLSFGMQIGRIGRRKAIFLVGLLAAGAFFSFLIGKSYQLTPWRTYLAFFVPQAILIFLAFRNQRRISRGIE